MSDQLWSLVAALLAVVAAAGIGWALGRREARRPAAELASERTKLQSEVTQREEFISVVAHELRNPLQGIVAASRVLARTLGEGGTSETAKAISQEARAALELLDSLTDVARIEAGTMTPFHPVDLATIVRDVANTTDVFAHEVRTRGTEAPQVVLGDERRLAQVVRNLLTNAAKYSPAEALIEITVGRAPSGSRALVEVRDHGTGIPPAERSKLFKKFARLTTAGGTRGTGLGLYICRGIVQDHRGELRADWPAGGGTAFSFTIPLA